MGSAKDYYVYIYIDPRNFQLFYVGKGTGSRKYAHFGDLSDSLKTRRIQELQSGGVEPVIRVVATDLTQEEAFIVESTLIWEHFGSLTNLNKGHGSTMFRPQNTMHIDLQGFDYVNNIYYVNVGENERRNWDDCMEFGFLCAGGDSKWSDPLLRLNPGDVVIAYLKGSGYVGVGAVDGPRQKAVDFVSPNGRKLIDHKGSLVEPRIFENAHDDLVAQYCVPVDWKKAVGRDNAAWKRSAGLFTSQQIVASLLNQKPTIDFVSAEFGLDVGDLIK